MTFYFRFFNSELEKIGIMEEWKIGMLGDE